MSILGLVASIYPKVSDQNSPLVLTLEVSCARTVFPGPLLPGVPGQELHHVVWIMKAALALDGLGRAHGEEEDCRHKPDARICLPEERVDALNVNRGAGLPVWKAQQRSGLQSLWCQHVLPASPLVAL